MIEEIAERAYSGEPMPRGHGGSARRPGDLRPAEPSPTPTAPTSPSSTSTPTPPRSRFSVSSRSTTAECGSTRWSSRARSMADFAEGVGIALIGADHRSTKRGTASTRRSWTVRSRQRSSARLRARRDRYTLPAPSARSEGRRRVADRRVAAGDRRRCDRRLACDAPGRAHRHAVHPSQGLGGDAGARRAAAMITPELSRRSQELTAAREPFVTATVVRVQHPASVQPGSVALVLADGTIDGFVGGVCARASVRAYSLAALDSGEPVLLRIVPDPEPGAAGDAAPRQQARTGS